MLAEIKKEGDFFVAYYFGNEVSRKKTLLQVTKSLYKYIKGRS